MCTMCVPKTLTFYYSGYQFRPYSVPESQVTLAVYILLARYSNTRKHQSLRSSRQTPAFLCDLYGKRVCRFNPPPILAINFPYKHDYIEVPYGENAMVPTAEKC